VLFSAATGMLLGTWALPLRTGDLAETPEAHLHRDCCKILPLRHVGKGRTGHDPAVHATKSTNRLQFFPGENQMDRRKRVVDARELLTIKKEAQHVRLPH